MNTKTHTLTQTQSNKNINNINKLQLIKVIKSAQLRTTCVILLMLISVYCLIQ